MKSKAELTEQITKRTSALAKKTAEGSKAAPEDVRLNRKQLKRSYRQLAKLNRAEKLRKGGAAEAKEAAATPPAS